MKNKNQVYAYSHDVGPPLLSGAADAAGQSRRPQIYASAARDLIYPATIDTIPLLQRYMRTWRIAEQPIVSLKRGPKTSPSTPWREAEEPLVKKRKRGKRKVPNAWGVCTAVSATAKKKRHTNKSGHCTCTCQALRKSKRNKAGNLPFRPRLFRRVRPKKGTRIMAQQN